MKYCENCGAKLTEGVKFCEECGSMVAEGAENAEESVLLEKNADDVKLPEETSKPIVETSEPLSLEEAPCGTAGQPPIQESIPGKSRKKPLIIILVILMLLAGAAIAVWKFVPLDYFGKNTQPTAATPAEAADQDNLYGTLNWQEDQDKTYELKNLLIEGNSDANIKEIFEESAYFTPSAYKYAEDGNDRYYLITCEYKKDEETAPYALVFQTNKDEHLELAELYKSEQRVEQNNVSEFYESLYITKEAAAEAEKKAKEKAAEKKAKNSYYFKKGEEHFFYNAAQDAYLQMAYAGGNCIYANIWSGVYDEETGERDFNFTDIAFYASVSDRENHIVANELYFCDEGDAFQLDLTVTTTDDVTDKDFPYMVIIEDDLFPDTSLVSGTYYEFYPD